MEKKESYIDIYRLFSQIMKLSFAEAFPHFQELKMHPAQAELLDILYQNPRDHAIPAGKNALYRPIYRCHFSKPPEEAGYV